MSVSRDRRRVLRPFHAGRPTKRAALRSLFGRLLRYVYRCPNHPHQTLQYSAEEWRRADRTYRKIARFKKRHSMLSYAAQQTAIESGHEEIDDDHDAPSIVSDDTLASDRTETEPVPFMALLISLTQAERVRRVVEPAIAQLKDKIKIKQDGVDHAMTELRHLSRSQRPSRPSSVHADVLTGLRSKGERSLQLRLRERQELLIEMHGLETRLSGALAVQREGEPRMCRAVQGFIRNLDGDPDEKLVPRGIRFWLRYVADWSRSPLWSMMPESSSGAQTITIGGDLDGEIRLNPTHEVAMRRANHYRLMRQFYTHIEPFLTEGGDLPPEEGAPEQVEAAVRLSAANEAQENQRQKVLKELVATRDAVVIASNWLSFDLRRRCREDLENYMRTYRVEPEEYDAPAQQSPDNPFDREFLRRGKIANRKIREAEANYREAQNEAIRQKVFDPAEEDLFGVRDHASDGFVGSMGSWQRMQDDLLKAEKRPSIHLWLQTAHGLPSEDVEAPSEIANIPTTASVRDAISYLEPALARRDVMQRWEAERIVTRAEEERRRLEHYRLLGQPAPRGIY